MMSATEIESKPEVIVLAAASSQTDAFAQRALQAFGFSTDVLLPLTMFGFISRAANEWQIEPGLRRRVLEKAPQYPELWRAVNRHYLELAGSAMEGLPAYLATGPGFAYHSTELDPSEGVHRYREVAELDVLAANVQGLRLADEQAERGLIEADSPDLLFLRAMTYYRSHRQAEGIELLRAFMGNDDGSREVAIAQHLVAHWDCQRGDVYAQQASRALFKKSLNNAVKRGDKWHQAQVTHSMALCIARQRPKSALQAASLLESSLQLLSESGDQWGRAKVLHSLGQVLTDQPAEHARALKYLNESRAIGLALGYQGHVRLVDESLEEWRSRRPSESTRRRRARKKK